ncbi:MAG: HD domain-containing protein [Bacillota bacterium]
MELKNYHTQVGNPVEELKSTQIWNRLTELNPVRANEACEFVRLIDPILNSISSYFPLYTRHDCHHGYEVIERMYDVIKPNLLLDSEDSFTDDELFCLIISAYAHDVGMTLYENNYDKEKILNELGLPNDVDNHSEKLCNYLRDNHADRGLQFLRNSDVSKYVPEHLRGLIGGIMKGHNMTPKALMSELPKEAAIGRKSSDPRALSVILCCADAIEFSDTRVLDIAFNEAKSREDDSAQRSLIEMRKHRSVGCGLAVSKEGLIIAAGDFDDAQVLHATHSTLDQMESWIKDYIIFNNRLKRPVLRLTNHSIIRDAFTMDGFKYFPIAIKIDEYQIKELLTSQRLWGNEPGVPIRELVQNAVEACRYRSHITPMISDYNPKVEIIVDYDNREISVVDNGCGMDENDITDFFLQIGKSKSRDPKFKADLKNTGYESIARFGVGFWSVFSIADIAIVSTHAFNYQGISEGITFNVSIYPVMRYLEIKKDSTVPVGTRIKLRIKKDIDISRLLEDITRYIIVGAVPIFIKDSNANTIHTFDTILGVAKPEDIFGYRSNYAEFIGIDWFNHEIDDNDIELRIGIAYSKINDEYRCLLPDGNSMFNLSPSGEGFRETTSVCGFRTGMNFGSIPFATGRVGALNINIKTPKGLVYSFNRLSLDENDRYIELQDRIIKYISHSLDLLYQKLNIKNSAEKISLLISDSRSNGGEAGDSRIPGLYHLYEKYYKKMVPISLLFWVKNSHGNVTISEKTIFIDEFWEIDKPVEYVCIWPSARSNSKIIAFLNSIINKYTEGNGYILLASHEASAIIDVAKSARVKTTNIIYQDWHQNINQYIEINPRKGYEIDKKFIMKLSSKWSGDVSMLDFARVKANKPWMSFGRYRMFVDIEHDLIKKLIDLYDKGRVWEAANILSLMSVDNESNTKEIERLSGISANY